MAASARTIRAIKPHIPMIKFPLRTPGQDSSGTSAIPSSQSFNRSATPVSTSNPPSASSSNRIIIEESELPERYCRKPISQEEMEYIERGGPE